MYKNKDCSLWSMVIFWPVSGTAYFPVLRSFPFIREGSKPPPDFHLKKEAAPSVSMGIPMAMSPLVVVHHLPSDPVHPSWGPHSSQDLSQSLQNTALLPSPESFFLEISKEKDGEKPCSPQYFYFSLVDKRAFRWWTGIEFLVP